MWAGRAAASGLVVKASLLYGTSKIPFRDITAGNNGHPAGPGYDMVTGLGSWTGKTP
jgi:hypothetical protein